MRRAQPLQVAIVGMACRFPGADDLVAFWENIVAGRDAITDVPADRWDLDTFYDPGSTANDRVYCRRGGFLNAPIGFDAAAHGIMPRTVEGGEPEQFLVLDAARAALDDAGLTDGVPDGRRVEVVIGRGNYFNRGNLTRLQHGRIVAQTAGILRALHPEWSDEALEAVRADLKASLPPFGPDTVAGQLTNATAGRVANRLDLRGASFVIDAASASSLVALDLGARALAERRADLALVGGVYLGTDIDFPMVFCQLGAFSRAGRIRPFADGADGTLPGEGVGVVILKRRADAERDGDRIYAIVQGVGVASDGRGRGLAAPSARGHARAMRRALRQAGMDPATVALVEGHGLGVPAADRAELCALRAVFPPLRTGRRVLGAVSSMIGHAMPAAGMAGLIKTALALYHRVLPPTVHADSPHPLLAGAEGPFELNRIARPWLHAQVQVPRRAGVNAFGFAGISAHAVLEDHARADAEPRGGGLTHWESEAILLGASDRAEWLRVAGALGEWLGRSPAVELKDLAWTLNTGQPPFPFRVGMVVSSLDDLRDRLDMLRTRLADGACQAIRDSRGTYLCDPPLAGPGRLAFMFPGEGSQYPGMLADLCMHFPEVRAVFDVAERVAWEQGHARAPSALLFGATGTEADEPGLWAMSSAINGVLTSQWALYRLLGRLGLRPDAVVGHSSGELLALAAAGAIEVDRGFEDGLGRLGKVFDELEASDLVPPAALVAVAADRERVLAACHQSGHSAAIAMDNCPHQVVLSCRTEHAGAIVACLREAGLVCEPLPFARAYHTPEFAQALGPVERFFAELPLHGPGLPVYTCSRSDRMPAEPAAIRSLLVEQWTRPVEFRATIERMHAEGIRLFVDVGARGNLASFVDDTLRGRPAFAIAANLPRRSGLTQLNHLVAALYAHGVDLQPGPLYARRRPVRLDLSRDVPAPRARPALAVGFPEMKLSPALLERLRAEWPAKAGPAECAADGHAAANGDERANGHSGAHVLRGEAPADEAMLSYLASMDAFLETQRRVMDAYLSAPEPAPVLTHAPQPPEPLQRANAALIPGPALERALLEKVSERTGYPVEMLQLDLDMEGDLGIDSIKRVEILNELQARGELEPNPDLDRLSRCRTLRQVIAVLAPAGPEAGPPGALPETGPWVGEIQHVKPGRELRAVRWLDCRTDPVAENHTLGGRRVSAVEPERKGLPVLPFTVMTEMMAQAAAVLVPGQALVALRDVRAHRWIRYHSEPVALEIRARRNPERPDEVRVEIVNRGTAQAPRPAGEGPAVEGTAVFAPSCAEGPLAGPFTLPEPGPCRFTADELYRDQWLFHGPPLRALTWVGPSSPHGIDGTLRVLPLAGLLPAGERDTARLLTDPIVLDAFTHLLGCWGLDKLTEGDVIFPLGLAELRLYGPRPADGSEVACRIRVREVQRHRVRVDADLVGPDGRLWMRLEGWDDWRFYWPSRYRDQFRMPDRVFVGEPIELPGLPPELTGSVQAVWLEPPADMARPVWSEVLEWLQLSPAERGAGASVHVWERIAAKEAARRLWLDRGGPPVYPADLELALDAAGQPRLRSLLGGVGPELEIPAVSTAQADGAAVAVAVLGQGASAGIAVERISERALETPSRRAPAQADPIDFGADGDGDGDRVEWEARVRCARRAAARATGLEPDPGPECVRVVAVDRAAGMIQVHVARAIGSTDAQTDGISINVATVRRGSYAWAWCMIGR